MSNGVQRMAYGVGLLIIGGLIGYYLRSPKLRPDAAAPAATSATATTQASAERGAKLVTLGGCDDCHTPKLQDGALDMSQRFSGFHSNMPLPPAIPGMVTTNMHLTAWRGPWGLSISRNISPDSKTGIGGWTQEQFIKTLRTGVDPNGRKLMPPMPVEALKTLPDQDLADMYAYLKTAKPIVNQVSQN